MTLRNRKQFHYKFHEKTAKIRFYSVSKELICNTPRLNFQKELLNYHGKERKPSKQLEGRKDKHKRDMHGWIKFFTRFGSYTRLLSCKLHHLPPLNLNVLIRFLQLAVEFIYKEVKKITCKWFYYSHFVS